MSIKQISAKAKEIRTEGESWPNALKRAAQLLSDNDHKVHVAGNASRMQSRR